MRHDKFGVPLAWAEDGFRGTCLPRLAELRPGERVRFQATGEDVAVQLAREMRERIRRIDASLVEVKRTAAPTSDHSPARNLIDGVISALD
ncbi:hypothetical protein ACRQ5Q_12220 [Bradyrhizobium sp. PMVTL-01]|uniref:hypothetical protein n=1 Tax=unclassified Bradyrhizobium TaxID=2631580 RepID=UPI003F72CA11